MFTMMIFDKGDVNCLQIALCGEQTKVMKKVNEWCLEQFTIAVSEGGEDFPYDNADDFCEDYFDFCGTMAEEV